jgi:predicted O-linked N-acetylglucosamine transferase (SPINDLY family)
MGCPLVTITGETFAGRVATSLLRATGLADLALPDLPAYERALGALAQDARARSALRVRTEAGASESALFDTPRFVRALEVALQEMAGRAAAPQHDEPPHAR